MGNILSARTVASITALALTAAGFTGCASAADAETVSPSATASAPAEVSPTPSPSPTPTKTMTYLDYAKHDIKFNVDRATKDDPFGMHPEFNKVVSDDGSFSFSPKEAEAAFQVGMNTYLKLRTDPEFSRATRTPESDAKALRKYKTLTDYLLNDAKANLRKDNLFTFVPHHFALTEWLWEGEGKDINDYDNYLIDTLQDQRIRFDGLEFTAGRTSVTNKKTLEFNFTEDVRYKLADDHYGSVISVSEVNMTKENGKWMVDGLHWNTWEMKVWNKDGDVLHLKATP